LSPDLARYLVQDFLKNSSTCVERLLEKLLTFKKSTSLDVKLYRFEGEEKREMRFSGERFFLRTSLEYSNPQLTVEEVQGIIAVRILEVCVRYFGERKMSSFDSGEIDEICDLLKTPPSGVIVPFILNADDVEADRYSMNPLRSSILKSGQSAFPAASVDVGRLEVDLGFLSKYEGTLISRKEIELIDHCLDRVSRSYLDFVDMVKYSQLSELSGIFGIDLCLPSLRLPLEALAAEGENGLMKSIIEKSHSDYASIETIYRFMGRSLKNRTTLLSVPHSARGFGSKRAARGKLHFTDHSLTAVTVGYRTAPLYPNAIDPEDVSVAEGNDSFTVDGSRLIDYSYSDTPSSPQFILYSLASPEDACLWHGIGSFGAKELVRSYTSTHMACVRGEVFRELIDNSKLAARIPLQFNLVPKGVWAHPIHNNIDASIGCVENLDELIKYGMWMEYLSPSEYLRA
jgi:hypothetical protein